MTKRGTLCNCEDCQKLGKCNAFEAAVECPVYAQRHFMDDGRFNRIMYELEELTDEDKANGWHFCCEMDGLLLNANLPENDFCHCLKNEVRKEQS